MITDLEAVLQSDSDGAWLRMMQTKLWQAHRASQSQPRTLQLALEKSPGLLEQLWQSYHPQTRLPPLSLPIPALVPYCLPC